MLQTRSRLGTRLAVVPRGILQRVLSGRRQRPGHPRRILVAHHLLLGDTLMLTPLLAKLRGRHPAAEIVMTAPKAIAPLYEHRPYGVAAVAYDPGDAGTLAALRKLAGFDLAVVPGDNRFGWLALALGAKWIVAFAGDRPVYKSWPVDELIPYPDRPAAWGDMVAALIPGAPPAQYRRADWQSPGFRAFDLPASPYCVLHVGASSALKRWESAKWLALADRLSARGLAVVWSAGREENGLVEAIDPRGKYPSLAGKLDLAQMWHLLERAALLVCPDTGIAHLGRVVDTPTVALFGPGSLQLVGAGEFWRASRYRGVTIENFPCRDQRILFKREIAWVRRCQRTLAECPAPACMHAIDVDTVMERCRELLDRR
jgi:ADP-heptose:LPS heptosyltransferase